jgi:hypothetical protein
MVPYFDILPALKRWYSLCRKAMPGLGLRLIHRTCTGFCLRRGEDG